MTHDVCSRRGRGVGGVLCIEAGAYLLRREMLRALLQDLLVALATNAGRVMTRGQLIDRIWGQDYVGDTKTLDVHIKRLRAKVEVAPSDPKLLVTVRGLGYKFEV